ncbi:UDP-3-O-(3-hydroxymyristoyl)glucosamine N-acyltransferase [Candidatus Endobugula sertula]|uniref:UDP-3-O-acylglucosamine N-acyltransferase n=1 Tax=Candidatus Endobugula sertula TaxID=62101 RepID=A0A1D2QQR1_9GAMM|nr:UDP-3-O-(3-hydroxymyristoyl)glucosamine N-acyltransferase [Candidatus Endobugula sertula]
MAKKISYTLGDICQQTDSVLIGDEDYLIHGLNTLQEAMKGELSFLSNASYQKYLKSSHAGAVILTPDTQDLFDGNKLVTEQPYYVFAQVTRLFVPVFPEEQRVIHSSVIMGDHCHIPDCVSIAANVVIGNRVHFEENVTIGAGCVIGDDVTIGHDSILYPNVTIYNKVTIGSSAIIHSQVVIGSDGFGFAPNTNTKGWQKVHQLGSVHIGHDVEIGAGTTIDRGAINNTIIGNGVKLDNQIQIAHNVEVGENTAIAGATAIAGSAVIGKRCTIAGAVGIIGHITISDDVHITAMTLVTKSIDTPGSYSSGTAMNTTSEWRKNAACFNRLSKQFRKIQK